MSRKRTSTDSATTGTSQAIDAPVTVIVVSEPATAPSMVTTALQHLGVHIDGYGIAALVEREDREEKLRALAEQNNALHSVWGFELRAFRLLPSLFHLFRDPRVVVTFRDPVSVSEGDEGAAERAQAERLTAAATDSLALVEMVRALPARPLLVSYHRALSDLWSITAGSTHVRRSASAQSFPSRAEVHRIRRRSRSGTRGAWKRSARTTSRGAGRDGYPGTNHA